MDRRSFLGGMLLSGLGGFSLKTLAETLPQAMPGPVGSAALLDPALLSAGADLAAMPKLINESRQAGLFKATLIAAPARVPLLSTGPTEFWAYNGSLPGPLIEVTEGDNVEITLVNQLTQPTTIHWHGLPVPPGQDGNPHDAVAPGQSHTYRFTLPVGCAGSYWYHPHPHLLAAEQVYRGMAGGFIVRARQDPLAQIPERSLILSDLKLDARGQIAPNDSDDWMNGREGQFVLTNGQNRPVLRFSPQGRERWRVWNANSARYLRLQLPGSTLTLVGTDGGLLEKPQAGLEEYLLAPGQRAEFIVDAGQRRDLAKLVSAVYDRGKMGDVAPEHPIAILSVDFSAVSASALPPLPDKLVVIPDLGKPVAHKRVVFSESMSMRNGQHEMKFLVNGRQYDMNRIDLKSRAGDVEVWEIANQADMDHPFHLHGTQFQVLSRELDGEAIAVPYKAWHDTVNLKSGETVRIKTVQHWPGIRMFHCHILEHEAAGMMGQLKVI
ncbi:multicopper oxidase family protein [Paludibacterium purpuratum]|uniref:FtsP/CotA-like multicopper oxidase with cupredoxin domain n=1 Tax=Paludibacterium purpuratum TaxID=1144873 RepID=A0A4R7B4R2_9NEIS|nr:multicopper oxidase family protein [Paludibacterium purpuratum]TDR77830.1 FtsP/CotA-like multicopper oxidase with cupredoxin domain [Paludibacterium purpuratum]